MERKAGLALLIVKQTSAKILLDISFLIDIRQKSFIFKGTEEFSFTQPFKYQLMLSSLTTRWRYVRPGLFICVQQQQPTKPNSK